MDKETFDFNLLKIYKDLMLRKRNKENELCLIKLEMKKIEIENEIGGNPINLKKEILRIKRKNKRSRKKIVRDLNKIHLQRI